ncbi:MAG TPA: hypothetical protein VGJ69_08105 [Pyrinomonadaceae bacterium]
MLRIVFLVLFSLLAVPVQAQQTTGARKESGDGCLMYGTDHLFAIKAPSGWTVDTVTGQKLGLHAVMYPNGSSWRDATATMYTNFVHKDTSAPTIEKVIASDLDGYKRESPNVIIEDAEKLPIAEGKEQVIVKRFHGDRGGNFDAVAYIDESKVVILIVLTARSEKDFQATWPLFKDMIHTYRFVSDTVTLPK